MIGTSGTGINNIIRIALCPKNLVSFICLHAKTLDSIKYLLSIDINKYLIESSNGEIFGYVVAVSLKQKNI